MPKYAEFIYSDDLSVDMFWNHIGKRMRILEKIHKLSDIKTQYTELEFIGIKKSIIRKLRKNTRKKEYDLLRLINNLIKNISRMCL